MNAVLEPLIEPEKPFLQVSVHLCKVFFGEMGSILDGESAFGFWFGGRVLQITGDDSGQWLKRVYFFGKFEYLLPELVVFLVDLFDNCGLDFGDLLVFLLIFNSGRAEGDVSIGVRRVVPVKTETLSSGVDFVLVVCCVIIGVEPFSEVINLLLVFLNFLELIFALGVDFGL